MKWGKIKVVRNQGPMPHMNTTVVGKVESASTSSAMTIFTDTMIYTQKPNTKKATPFRNFSSFSWEFMIFASDYSACKRKK